MFPSNMTISGFDDELWHAIQDENRRQEDHIELIASENYASPRVMEAQGSQLTNKYAEGYPGRRYYGGCEHVDIAEQLGLAGKCRGIPGPDAARGYHSGHESCRGRPPDSWLQG